MKRGRTDKMRLRPVALVSAVLAALLAAAAFVPSRAEAKVRGGYRGAYSLRFSTAFSYGKRWGDVKGSSSFGQQYAVGLNGFIIDPRLATFNLSTGFSHVARSGSVGSDKWKTGVSLRVTMFEGIDRDRGRKFLKYMPSPIILTFSKSFGNEFDFISYGLGMYYWRQGYIQLLAPGKFISFDGDKGERRRNVNRNENRYRSKPGYEGDGNWNRNGDGNWNRNGDGNWNRNGDGNWNRNGDGNWNGNGNWNRNGNGNWNRNGNGNWNRNGNGNWNRNGSGNWNRNGSGNWSRSNDGNWSRNTGGNWAQGANWNFGPRRKPIRFRFPGLSMDVRRSETKSKDTGIEYTSTMAILRASVENPSRGSSYRSRYRLRYRYIDNSRKTQSLRYISYHTWKRTQWVNHAEYEDINNNEHYLVKTNIGHRMKLRRNISVSLGAGGKYEVTDGEDSLNYHLGGTGASRLSRRDRLSPRLVSKTSLSASLGRREDDNTLGEGRNVYGFTLAENLAFTHIDRFPFGLSFSVGYTQSGAVYGFSFGGDSRGFRKVKFGGRYDYSSSFPRLWGKRNDNHVARLYVRYNRSARLSFRGEAAHRVRKVGDGVKSERELSSVGGSVRWKPGMRSTLNVKGGVAFSDGNKRYILTGQYRKTLTLRSRLSLSSTWGWGGATERKEYLAIYSWRARKFSFYAEYRLVDNDGVQVHRLMLRIKRTFGRRLRPLFG